MHLAPWCVSASCTVVVCHLVAVCTHPSCPVHHFVHSKNSFCFIVSCNFSWWCQVEQNLIFTDSIGKTYCCNTLASRKYFLTHDLFFAFAALFIMFVSSDTICLKKGGYNLQFKCSTKFCKLRILTNALILREIFPLETKHCQCTIVNKTKNENNCNPNDQEICTSSKLEQLPLKKGR